MKFNISRRFVLIVGLMLAVGSASCALQAQGLRPHEPLNPAKAQSLPTSPLTIQSGAKTHSFVVELADTDRQREIGLMHRNDLAANHGMLFDFQGEQMLRFWMRNTFIPLDMIFIRATGEIIFIAENTVPHSDAQVASPQPVQAVLEVPGGTSARLGLKAADIVHHQIFKNSPAN